MITKGLSRPIRVIKQMDYSLSPFTRTRRHYPMMLILCRARTKSLELQRSEDQVFS